MDFLDALFIVNRIGMVVVVFMLGFYMGSTMAFKVIKESFRRK